MENTNGIKPWQWIVTAIVVIVLIIIGIMVFGNKSSETPAPVTDKPAVTDTTTTGNRIVMSDQYPGDVAYVSSVQLANPGWVVIQKNVAGKPADIMGSAYAPSGISPVKVTLSKPMVDGALYFAVLYSDNGDKKFDAATDKPLTDSNGNIIMKTFKATISAGVEIKG